MDTKIINSSIAKLDGDRIPHNDQLPPEISCRVCRKIVSVMQTPPDQPAREQLGTISDILSYHCPHVKWFQDVKTRFESRKQSLGQSELFFGKYGVRTAAHLGRTLDGEECAFLQLNIEKVASGNPPTGRARVLKSDCIDLDVIRQWKESCITNHGIECNMPQWLDGLEKIQPDWLIDVLNGCMVPADGKDRIYITLSYAWGQSRNLRNRKELTPDLQKPDILTTGRFAEHIPNTIQHAMWLTAQLGEQFLWVDSLCIVQDDEANLYRNLNQMHLIYAGAFLCIVAEEGDDADFGLRGFAGVSEPRTTCQTIIELASGIKLSTIQKMQYGQRESLGDQHYHNRAWTLQEIIFSKRQLFFGKGPVKWVCECAEWHEGLIPLSSVGFHEYDSTIMMLRNASEGIKTRSPSLYKLREVVGDFSKRSLTFGEDALPAFQGMQSFMHKVYAGGLLFGHPELFFDISLLWWNSGEIVKRHSSKVSTTDLDLYRLPSWSWLSWKGSLDFTTDSNYEESQWQPDQDRYTRPVTKWFTMNSPNSDDRRPIENQRYTFRKLDRLDCSLRGWEKLEGEEICVGDVRYPPYDYYHVSAPSQKFGFPVPVQEWNSSQAFHEQTPYLYCKTEHIFLYKESPVSATDPFPPPLFCSARIQIRGSKRTPSRSLVSP